MTLYGAFVRCNGLLGPTRKHIILSCRRSTGYPYRLGQLVAHRTSVMRKADDERIATAL
jgi:hypothetical protein